MKSELLLLTVVCEVVHVPATFAVLGRFPLRSRHPSSILLLQPPSSVLSSAHCRSLSFFFHSSYVRNCGKADQVSSEQTAAATLFFLSMYHTPYYSMFTDVYDCCSYHTGTHFSGLSLAFVAAPLLSREISTLTQHTKIKKKSKHTTFSDEPKETCLQQQYTRMCVSILSCFLIDLD